MANLTKSWKAQTLNFFGPSPAEQWGAGTWNTMVWGTNTWGMKAAGSTGVPRIIWSMRKNWTKSNSTPVTSPANTLAIAIFKRWSGSNASPLTDVVTSTRNRRYTLTGTNTITPRYANSDKKLTDGRGYAYVFPGPTTNIESSTSGSFTSGSAASTTWTSGVAAATSWS